MNKNAIALFLVAIGGLIVALFLGSFVAQGDFFKLGLLAGGVAVTALCIGMRENIWMLIPLCSALSGSILILPLPFAVNELAVLLAFATFLILFAMKALPGIATLNRYDGLMIINLVYLLTVYIRNPAGLLRFGTDIIGARPYAAILIALLAFWVLQHIVLKARQRFLIPILTGIGGIGGALVSIVTALIPSLTPIILPFYSKVTFSADTGIADPGASGSGRAIYLSDYGQALGPLLVAFRDPVRLLLFINPALSLLFFSAVGAIMLSGFRSFFLHLFALAIVSSYFRTGISGLFRIALAGILALTILISLQEAGVQLPLPAQRTLSFLPGSWDPEAQKDARSSSEWRFEMWRQALTTERYIRSKIFGDGFGYRMSDLAGFLGMGGMGLAGTENIQEYFLVIGAYHSGPVSTIRTVGVVGLVFFNIWIFSLAFYALKIIKASKNTPFFVWALFVGSPVLIFPAFYWLIFGGLENDFPRAILDLTALNLLSRSMEKWKTENETTSLPQINESSALDRDFPASNN